MASIDHASASDLASLTAHERAIVGVVTQLRAGVDAAPITALVRDGGEASSAPAKRSATSWGFILPRQQYARCWQRFARVLSRSTRVDPDHRETGERPACRKPENGCQGVR
jgi:hypothetical protein